MKEKLIEAVSAFTTAAENVKSSLLEFEKQSFALGECFQAIIADDMNNKIQKDLFEDQIEKPESKKNDRRMWKRSEADFVLRHMFDMKPFEIASELGRTEQAVRSRLRNIRRAAFGGIVHSKRRGV